jgi:ketosteroid isomerase-like protein
MNPERSVSPDPLEIVRQFNDCINRQDLDGLAALMTDDHALIDSSAEVHAGKTLMLESWKEFFKSYPDYKNHFKYYEVRGEQVHILGFSSCSFDPLDGPAIWTARVRGNQVSEWRVYLDIPENRQTLDLPLDPGSPVDQIP